ncbi:MAG: tyrosine-type recombinase/integrase [Candidatus Paceibacteria bacterium]
MTKEFDEAIELYRTREMGRVSESWQNAINRGLDLIKKYENSDDYYTRGRETEWNKYNIEDFESFLRENYDYSGSYIQNHLTVFRQFLQYSASEFGYSVVLDKNHANSIFKADLKTSSKSKKKKLKKENMIYVTPDQHRNLLDNLTLRRDRILIRILWQTGVRVGELSEIQIKDINRNQKEIKIKTLKNTNEEKDPIRYVPYKLSLEHELRKWIDQGEREAFGRTGPEEAEERYLLNTQRSPQMSRDQISARVRHLCRENNIGGILYDREQEQPVLQDVDDDGEYITETETVEREYWDITAHSWRHGFAMRCLENGMPLPYITYLMGHESVEITENMYMHVDRREARGAYRDYM